MSFTSHLLNGCVLPDIVKIINKYFAPINPTLNSICSFGLFEHLVLYNQSKIINFNDRGFNSACSSGYLDIVLFMIKYGATNWNEGLYEASKSGHSTIIKLLIKKKAFDWNWALFGACQGGHLDIANLMIQNGAKLTKKNSVRWNEGLSHACKYGHIDIANLMVKHGASNCSNCLFRLH
jgi:ankyrin repeat protein